MNQITQAAFDSQRIEFLPQRGMRFIFKEQPQAIRTDFAFPLAGFQVAGLPIFGDGMQMFYSGTLHN
jgi:hypothetical protein